MKVSLNNDAKSAPSDKAFAVNVSYSSVDGNNNNVKMVETITRNTSSLTQSTKGALYSNAGDSGSLKLGGKGASGAQRLVIPVINATTDKVKIPGYDSRWDKTLFPNK